MKTTLKALRIVAAAVALAGTTLVARPAQAENCTCSGGLTDIVDFSKPPGEIEGQNKIRIGVQPTNNGKGGLTVEVSGSAYYPDGVAVILRIRHWKVRDSFDMKKVVVKDHTFSAKFGPFAKALPAGGLTVEAWFMATTQSEAVRAQLVKDKYFRTVPPCRHDERNLTQVTFSLGGSDAEAEAEKAEKEQIATTRKAILDAQKVADAAMAKVEAKQASPEEATRALTRLEADLKAAIDEYNKWFKGRQFTLFAARGNQLRALSTSVRDAARAYAVVVGATVPGFPAAGAGQAKTTAVLQAQKHADELKGFIEEADSLDKEWEKTGNDLPPAPEGDATKPGDAGKTPEKAPEKK